MAKSVFIFAEENLLIMAMIIMLLIKIEYDENREPNNLHTLFSTKNRKVHFNTIAII